MTIRWAITGDNVNLFSPSDAENGDTFLIDGASNTVAISGLSNTTAMVFGNGDFVDEQAYGASNVIYDHGRNTRIEVSSNPQANPQDTNVIKIYCFYWDQNATLEQTIPGSDPNNRGPGTKPTQFHQADLWSTIRPDGHGGTMVGENGVNIDLMYDVYIRPNQFLSPVPAHS